MSNLNLKLNLWVSNMDEVGVDFDATENYIEAAVNAGWTAPKGVTLAGHRLSGQQDAAFAAFRSLARAVADAGHGEGDGYEGVSPPVLSACPEQLICDGYTSAAESLARLESQAQETWEGFAAAVQSLASGTTTYTLEMRDGGSIEAGSIEAYTIEEAEEEACRLTEEWVRSGDWGTEGASIDAWWTLTAEDADGDEVEVATGSVTVEIDPDHESMIAEATRHCDRSCGDDPDDHDWTSEGEGGCTENPGVWSTGGTSMTFRTHCRVCGLGRKEFVTGSQRNPGEHDTVEYTMPEAWCAECEREECRYPTDEMLVRYSDCDDEEPRGTEQDSFDNESEAREHAATIAHTERERTAIAYDDRQDGDGSYHVFVLDY